MANSFAPIQFLQTDWNPEIWTATDNTIDDRTMFALTTQASGVPTDKNKYGICCILLQVAEKQIYLNVGTTDVPNWQPFGPGSGIPFPLVPGQYLTNDGTTTFWSLIDLATGVTGILDISHLDMPQIEAYLLSDNTFLSNLATALSSYLDGLVTVAVDGTTITGNGTTASPLVAHTGGSSGITSINGNTTAAQVIAAGSGISVSSASGTTTITNTDPGGNTLGTLGAEFHVGVGSTTSDAITRMNAVVKFGPYLIVGGDTVGPSGIPIFTNDPTTGSVVPVSNTLQGGIFVSEDGLTLYTIGISVPSSGNVNIVLTSYDQTLTQIATWSYSGTGRAYSLTSGVLNQAFFVKGTHLVTFCASADGGFGNAFATDFTMSGSSLTSPTDTNIQIFASSGSVTTYQNFCALDSSGNVYIQSGGSTNTSVVPQVTVTKYTYSSATFASVSTHSLVRPVIFGGTTVGGFTVNSGGTIVGQWTNSSVYSVASAVYTKNYSIIFNEYTY